SISLDHASAGILGFGPIGFSVLLAAQAAGGRQFFVTDKIDDRLKTARQQGVNYTGNPLTRDIVKEINETEQNQLDVVYECCGDQEAIDQAIDILKPGGKLMIIGIPESERMSFDVSKMRHKEITIQNVRRQVDCVQQAIDLIANKKISLEGFVTHRFTFDQTTEAFDLVEQYQDGVMKAMVTI
ncbi:MAG: zinc-binding dehydrogenase, partial [Bacteroidota bacterium]